MSDFFRYIQEYRPLTKESDIMLLFRLLECVRVLSRVGGYCTSHRVAAYCEVSVYKARKTLHECKDIGLVDWTRVEHRPNVHKRVYELTDKGRAVNHAYTYAVSGGIEK